ncbi:MAG: DMT family transporter [Methylocystaceae bacterium]
MANNISNRITGFVFLILSAAFYSTMPILSKFMYQTGLSPISALLLRYFFSLVILVVYLALIKRQPVFTRSPYAIIQGLLFVLGSLLYFYALKYLPAGLTTSIFYMYPAIVSVMAIVIYHERLALRQVLALILALAGIIIISGLLGESTHRLSPLGVMLVIGSCICYSGYTLLGQKTINQASALSLTVTMSLCGFVILALVFPSELLIVTHITLEQTALGVTMAVLNTILSVFCFLKGLAIVGASRASLVSTAEPAFSLLFAFILLGEIISPWQGFGVLLVLISTTIAINRK